MAKREFELPGIHELSKEQEEAIRLPMEGCHLIVGGPGTGKTVVTLLRLRRYVQQSKSSDSVFLVTIICFTKQRGSFSARGCAALPG